MITNYNKFLDDKLNEGIWNSLKNMFGKLLSGISDELKKPIDELTNKLSKTKDTKQIKSIIYNYLKVHKQTLDTKLKNVNDIYELKTLIKENLQAMYASIKAQVQSLGEENYSFSEIFEKSPEGMRKLFDKNEKQFTNNLNRFVNDLIIAQAKPFNLVKDEKKTRRLLDLSEDKRKEEEAKKIENVSSSLNIEQSEKLFEDDAKGGTAQGGTAQGGTAQAQNKDVQKPAQEPAAQAQNKDVQKPAQEPVKDENFEKLKTAIGNWFDLSIYKKMNETLKKEAQGTKTLEDRIKDMTITNNKDSVNKIVDAITKTDKETLKKVRDLLGLDKDSAGL